jgi:ABC-type transport system involved in cytochrome c biogenesis permease subunit
LWWRGRGAAIEHRLADATTATSATSAPPLALTLTAGHAPPLARALTIGARGSLALGASLFGCIVVIAQVFLEYHDINAFISPQMPILSEFWLRVHTSCVVSSYGLISLGGLMSLTYLAMRLLLPWNDVRCQAWDRTTFAINSIAAVVLWVGLCLGAVWAAQSWGRPWGWDPKEVFALLTFVVFVMLVHLRLAVAPAQRGMATALVSVSAFVVMAFNWYVVNVVLAGLHSYA